MKSSQMFNYFSENSGLVFPLISYFFPRKSRCLKMLTHVGISAWKLPALHYNEHREKDLSDNTDL